MQHVDVLDERDSLKRPLVGSLTLHAALFAFVAVMAVTHLGQREMWGNPNATGGGAFSVTPVKSIPLPGRTGQINRVASDTKSQIPEPVKAKVEPKRAVKEDPDAIALKSNKRNKTDRSEKLSSNRRDPREYSDNQVYSRAGQAAVSPLYSQAPGSGGVGVGPGGPLGTRCGGYAQLIRDRAADKWRTDQIDARIRTLPPAILTFDLLPDGQIRNLKVFQSSGNYALDASAQRAITEAAPFGPVPTACASSAANVEFWFELKR